METMCDVERLAKHLDLGSLLASLGEYDLLAHWTQGEFHHDVVVRARAKNESRVFVIATNCNGGVKEVLALRDVPDRRALWHHRCPDVEEFGEATIEILERAITPHYFDPCELLRADARSELKAEWRERDEGGGWKCRTR
jgi:hypothetical protein